MKIDLNLEETNALLNVLRFHRKAQWGGEANDVKYKLNEHLEKLKRKEREAES
mgnify:CR=1 FL=1